MKSSHRIAGHLRTFWLDLLRRPLLALFLIVAVAVFLRVWHYDFDHLVYNMPLTHDSYAKLLLAQRVARGTFQPLHYWQPYFLIYTTGALYWLAGRLGDVDILTLWNLSTFYMIVLSVLTTALTALIGRRLFKSWSPALLGAALFAVIPVNVMGSRYLKEDIPLMFVSCLGLLWMLRLLERGGWMDYLMAGLLVGIGAGTKYAAFGMVPFLRVFRRICG